jgi:hypothetical protein
MSARDCNVRGHQGLELAMKTWIQFFHVTIFQRTRKGTIHIPALTPQAIPTIQSNDTINHDLENEQESYL